MGVSGEVSGPDFTKGVSIDLIKEGEMLLGHVGDKGVLLVKVDGEIYAVGSHCTHYGAPLNDGLLVGHTLHCPWHHSTFSVKTGEALKAPALVPISCWSTEVRDDKIFVTGKKKIPVGIRRGTESQHIVIIGSGAAGTAAAAMLRRHGFAGGIQIISEDEVPPYDRTNLSKDYLAGNAQEDWMPLFKENFYERHKINLNLGVMAVRIEPRRKSVLLSDGRTIHYDKLLLATGGTPMQPPIPGIEKENVFMLRSMRDCQKIIDRTSWAQKVAIIGAGFIGLEVASSLRARNLEVHVIAPEEMPLLKALGVHAGSYLKHLHERNGVHFHLGHSVKEIRDRSILLDEGVTVECDFVIVGTGIKPNTALAQQAGCEIDHGVLVNEFLETSVPDIYAAGDIARWPDPRCMRNIRVEHWEVAERQGQVAASNMMGERVKFNDVPFFWTQHYDKVLCYIGFSDRYDRMDVLGDVEKDDFAIAYYEDDRVAAFLTVGRDRESLQIEDALNHMDSDKAQEIFLEYERHLRRPPPEVPNYFEPSP
ncbi:MAG: FAD-dependent oxidoreductase [Bdellovibrio sp.]|nr:FAD-dependent oxidoreductase [Bdellovibrio sp.]